MRAARTDFVTIGLLSGVEPLSGDRSPGAGLDGGSGGAGAGGTRERWAPRRLPGSPSHTTPNWAWSAASSGSFLERDGRLPYPLAFVIGFDFETSARVLVCWGRGFPWPRCGCSARKRLLSLVLISRCSRVALGLRSYSQPFYSSSHYTCSGVASDGVPSPWVCAMGGDRDDYEIFTLSEHLCLFYRRPVALCGYTTTVYDAITTPFKLASAVWAGLDGTGWEGGSPNARDTSSTKPNKHAKLVGMLTQFALLVIQCRFCCS